MRFTMFCEKRGGGLAFGGRRDIGKPYSNCDRRHNFVLVPNGHTGSLDKHLVWESVPGSKGQKVTYIRMTIKSEEATRPK